MKTGSPIPSPTDSAIVGLERLTLFASHLAGCSFDPSRTIWERFARELPNVFPEKYFTDSAGARFLKTGTTGHIVDDCMQLFHLEKWAIQHLVCRGLQSPSAYGGQVLGQDATPVEFIANVRALIEAIQTTYTEAAKEVDEQEQMLARQRYQRLLERAEKAKGKRAEGQVAVASNNQLSIF